MSHIHKSAAARVKAEAEQHTHATALDQVKAKAVRTLHHASGVTIYDVTDDCQPHEYKQHPTNGKRDGFTTIPSTVETIEVVDSHGKAFISKPTDGGIPGLKGREARLGAQGIHRRHVGDEFNVLNEEKGWYPDDPFEQPEEEAVIYDKESTWLFDGTVCIDALTSTLYDLMLEVENNIETNFEIRLPRKYLLSSDVVDSKLLGAWAVLGCNGEIQVRYRRTGRNKVIKL